MLQGRKNLNLTVPSQLLDGLRRSSQMSNPSDKVMQDGTNRLQSLLGRRERQGWHVQSETGDNGVNVE
jgi:hypothetical protein